MNYSEKLRDPRWQKKRLFILSRDKWTCKLCGDKETTLHVHHLEYNGEPWEADNKNLVTYCEDCHTIVEYYNKFIIIRLKKFYCSLGKLFMIQVDGSDKIYFEVVSGSVITEFAVFDKVIIQQLKKFFK